MAKIANSVGEVLARFQEFEKNHRYLSDGSASIPYEFSCYGKAPFVFCAPHASMLFARGRFKKRELATGALAQTLANAIGACSLKTCGYALSTDPLKTHALELAKEGRMLVDLHGMTSFHGCDICVGRGVAPSENTLELIDSLLRAGELLGLKIAVDKPFAGTSRHALTRIVQENRAEALQIELSPECRKPIEQSTKTILALTLFLEVFGFYSN